LILMEKDSVSRAPVWSCTWIVKLNRPSVVGLPVMPPEPTPWVNKVRPGGICPETTLNRTGFSDVRQPVVEKNYVFSVPILPSGKVVESYTAYTRDVHYWFECHRDQP
jgi:hypothetical protein